VIYDINDDDIVEAFTTLSIDENDMEVDGHHPKSHYWK
jgi:hypothetical protein